VPRSPKGKGKVIDGVGESSTSKESETTANDKANERLIDKLYAQKKALQTNLDSAKEKTLLAQAESTRLRELLKDRGNKINELTVREKTAVNLIKDQRDKIDDLTSKLQRSSEESKELVSKIDTMSRKELREGMSANAEMLAEEIEKQRQVNVDLCEEINELKAKREDIESDLTKAKGKLKELTL
jgi:chromosome segregation ATPase